MDRNGGGMIVFSFPKAGPFRGLHVGFGGWQNQIEIEIEIEIKVGLAGRGLLGAL